MPTYTFFSTQNERWHRKFPSVWSTRSPRNKFVMLCERKLFRTRDSWHEAEREGNISTSNRDEFSTKCYISLPILAVRKIYSTLFGRQLPFPYKLEWKFVTSNGVLSPNFCFIWSERKLWDVLPQTKWETNKEKYFPFKCKDRPPVKSPLKLEMYSPANGPFEVGTFLGCEITH